MKRSTSEPETLVLTDFLPYLVNRAGIKTGQSFSQELHAFGLTQMDWRILISLAQGSNQRLAELAAIAVIDVSTLSRRVASLERAGLIVRKRSRDDGRALNLTLSAKAKALLRKIVPIARTHASVAIRGLSDAEVATLKRCVTVIYENLIAAHDPGGGEGPSSGMIGA